ncbi:unnamed protein product [Brachionus calyciflorus]|uniref:Protein-tyrosine sulfotransferase n=1 Tax=Brachionus calyciflorus TaxID=104777 RepID=A0A813M423_9BILA|nr:unnamed protein product [Brachionus calyciflorus]
MMKQIFFAKYFQAISLKQTIFLLLLILVFENALILWKYLSNEEKSVNPYSNTVEDRIIFIGGSGRSGTTLMRVLLDVHGSVFCGPETKLLPSLMSSINYFNQQYPPDYLLQKTSIYSKSINEATANFIKYVLKTRKKQENKIICAKDPPILLYMGDLVNYFPKAKFIFMVRDGRDVALSMLKYEKKQYNFLNFVAKLKEWNSINNRTLSLCNKFGPNYCKIVVYEKLVTTKEIVLRDLMKFLELKWNNKLLSHENFMDSDVELGVSGWSNSQVIQPIYNKISSKNWTRQIEDYDEKTVLKEIPMLKYFGYV